jgi:hypothetical protein
MPPKEARKHKREIREAMRHALPEFSKDDIWRLAAMYFKSGATEPYRDFAAARVREVEGYWAQDFDKVRTDRAQALLGSSAC